MTAGGGILRGQQATEEIEPQTITGRYGPQAHLAQFGRECQLTRSPIVSQRVV